ncbi:MAG: sugar phosphate isomerase/epimerase [Clostridia bacterium]|nr:sugar phosphate isomerase/epimerase [Clostridia bacterium]
MKNGLAIWHYPHRTTAKNVVFFAQNGFESVSINGTGFVIELKNGLGDEIAEAVSSTGVYLTVHYCMPHSHSEEHVTAYLEGLKLISDWQKKYGFIKILSFDVPQSIRDNISEYINFALDGIENCSLALEDFGLTKEEREQIEYLKGNERFGYLIDIGHMYMRLRGVDKHKATLFLNSPDECEPSENPGFSQFSKAFVSKEFPILEIHLHNNDGENDTHLFLEDGTLKIEDIAKLLKSIDYKGVLTIESAPGYQFECAGADADNGILKTYSYWKECCLKA